MWSLPPPDIDEVDAQLTKALTYANGQLAYPLSVAERAAVIAVYQLYDAISGQPDPNLQPTMLAACRPYIHDGYDQIQIGGRLASLRATLLTSTSICPYCGFGEPTQLDHYLPKLPYGELAIYPRNLVPCCGPCNNAKRSIISGIGPSPGLIHAYFEPLPDIDFMRADVNFVDGALNVTFRIESVLLTPRLGQMLQYQLDRLKLNERYVRQVNKFLSEQRVAILMFKRMGLGSQQLSEYFTESARSLASEESFGKNDWRPALLRALASHNEFCADPEIYLGTKP